jgi:hypothetical protein
MRVHMGMEGRRKGESRTTEVNWTQELSVVRSSKAGTFNFAASLSCRSRVLLHITAQLNQRLNPPRIPNEQPYPARPATKVAQACSAMKGNQWDSLPYSMGERTTGFPSKCPEPKRKQRSIGWQRAIAEFGFMLEG